MEVSSFPAALVSPLSSSARPSIRVKVCWDVLARWNLGDVGAGCINAKPESEAENRMSGQRRGGGNKCC